MDIVFRQEREYNARQFAFIIYDILMNDNDPDDWEQDHKLDIPYREDILMDVAFDVAVRCADHELTTFLNGEKIHTTTITRPREITFAQIYRARGTEVLEVALSLRELKYARHFFN